MPHDGLSEEQFKAFYREYVLDMQDYLAEKEQTETPVENAFAPGVYIRTIYMPKHTFVIGKTHLTEHFNIVRTGKANVMIDGVYGMFQTSDMFTSKAGSKKVLWILEDMIWSTVHPTNETDMQVLEDKLILPYVEEKRLIMEDIKRLSL